MPRNEQTYALQLEASEMVYQIGSANPPAPPGYQVYQTFVDADTGFKGAIYINNSATHALFAFAGTETAQDTVVDLQQAVPQWLNNRDDVLAALATLPITVERID